MKRKKTKNHLHNLKPLILRIVDISRSGAGVARDETNRVTFVPFSAPGDLVKVKLTKSTSKFAEAQIMEIIEPSEQRIDAKCPVFTLCGGCQWQHLPYKLQWHTKFKGVCDSLQLNKIPLPAQVDEYPAKQIWHYRNRIQLKGNSAGLGFFQAKSNDLVMIDHCPIANEQLNATIPETIVQAIAEKKSYKVELSLSPEGLVSKHWNAIHAADGFRQVNDEQNKNLQSWIKRNLNENIAILDLFGGSGNLSRPLMSIASEIHCVDSHVPDTDESIPENYHYHQSSVLPWLKKFKSAQSREWIALIDPPRGGLGDELMDIIQCFKKNRVKTIVLVGCKTDPWTRDIAQLRNQHWTLEKLAVMDFFPQTIHVETVALLTKK